MTAFQSYRDFRDALCTSVRRQCGLGNRTCSNAESYEAARRFYNSMYSKANHAAHVQRMQMSGVPMLRYISYEYGHLLPTK